MYLKLFSSLKIYDSLDPFGGQIYNFDVYSTYGNLAEKNTDFANCML